jgi:hypothetical protein
VLLILIGLILIPLTAFCVAKGWLKGIFAPIIILAATILVMMGLFVPCGGYQEEPVVVETQVLYPLETGEENSDIYLVIELFDTSYRSSYRYCVSEGNEKTTNSRYTRAVIGDIDVPIFEKCVRKPKITIWSFAIGGKEEFNIIRVPQDKVEYVMFKQS